MGASPPADKFAEIADRLVTQTEEQVIRLGHRSGHWTEADVDWVVAGSTGPRPAEPTTKANADAPGPQPDSPASTVHDQAAPPAPEVTQPAAAATPVDDRDLLARGLTHPNPKVRAAAERAAIAVDQLITALTRRPS